MHLVRAAFAALLLMPLVQGQQELPPVVTTDTDAVVLMPPELVAAPVIVKVSASRDGRYVLVVRQVMKMTAKVMQDAMAGGSPPPVETKLVLWDNIGRTARDLWHSTAANVQFDQIEWFASGGAALIKVTEMVPNDPARPGGPSLPRYLLLRLVGSQLNQTDFGVDDPGWIDISPARPIALLFRNLPFGTALSILDPTGKTVNVSLPEGSQATRAEWQADGSPVVMIMPGRTPSTSPGKLFALDSRTGALREMGKDEALSTYSPKAAKPGPLTLKVTTGTVAEGGQQQPVKALWMLGAEKTEYPRTLVAMDSPGGQFLEKGESVLFEAGGAVWVRAMIRMPRMAVVEARKAAERTVSLSNAKQAALGLLMYAQDYDELMPPLDGASDAIMPYIKSTQVLKDFHYTFHSGKWEPTDELGYVTGPGGRAVLFGDGHVEWKNDQ